MLKPNYTQYQKDTHLLKNVIVLVDTREQENEHITAYFDRKKIEWRKQKLGFGDYTLLLKANPDFGIMHDVILDYAVERKASLEELSGNISLDRNRFESELWRANKNMALVIENNSIDNIVMHNYLTKYNEQSFLASIFTFMHRYALAPIFTSKENVGKIIFMILFYRMRDELK